MDKSKLKELGTYWRSNRYNIYKLIRIDSDKMVHIECANYYSHNKKKVCTYLMCLSCDTPSTEAEFLLETIQ